jgi:hypothetical protein
MTKASGRPPKFRSGYEKPSCCTSHTLDQIYTFDRYLGGLYPGNQNVRPKSASSCIVSATAGFWIWSRAGATVCDPEAVRMAWFLNFYRCARCRRIWTDQWSATCDDDCPHCGARHMSPFDSERLTTLIQRDGKEFVVPVARHRRA